MKLCEACGYMNWNVYEATYKKLKIPKCKQCGRELDGSPMCKPLLGNPQRTKSENNETSVGTYSLGPLSTTNDAE